MAGITATQTISGTNAKLFLGGEEIGFWQTFSAIVTINYEDVYVGSDVDRNEVSRQGDGTLSNQITNSMGIKLFNKVKAGGKNARFTIETEITNSEGETESVTYPNITLDSVPLADWEKGALAKSDISFRFLPSQVNAPQVI